METYFVFDQKDQFFNNIENEIFPSYLTYGAYHLKEHEKVNVIDKKDSQNISNSQVVINVPMYAPEFKKRGNRVILINLNSNHIIARNKNWLGKRLIKYMYNNCDVVMCLDKTQIKPLRDLGVTTRLTINPLLIDTSTFDREKTRIDFGFKNYSPFYLSSGVDYGRNFSGLITIDSPHPIQILGRHNAVPYNEYAKLVVKSCGAILNINNSAGSSDLSGSTTVFEFLAMKKPVFINPQPWLKNFPSKNIHVFNSGENLEKMLWENTEWIEENKDFSFNPYFKKLKSILKIKD